MESYTDETNNISYTYDSDGLRASKTVNGAKTIYQYVNSALYYQCTYTTSGAIDKELYFFYDSYGNLASIRCFTGGNEYVYYIATNTQGDVLGIYDSSGTNVASYEYDTWGNIISTTDTSPISIAELNPIRYRGYYYDSETELYYLQSRYYNPQVCRFLSADGYISTGQDILGYNMFAYCGNNPVNRADTSGMFWKEIGHFFKKVGTAIANFAKATFGAGATIVYKVKQENEIVPPVANTLVTVKTGTKESTTISKKGNSSKPISVYAQGRIDNLALSSVGAKINIASFTLDISLGRENIGISGSIKNGDTTNAFGISADISQFKVGFESSTTVKWDESTDITSYTNASVTGWGIIALFILTESGEWVSSPQPQPAYKVKGDKSNAV